MSDEALTTLDIILLRKSLQLEARYIDLMKLELSD